MVVQRLGLYASTAGVWVQSLAGEQRYRMPRGAVKGKKKKELNTMIISFSQSQPLKFFDKLFQIQI